MEEIFNELEQFGLKYIQNKNFEFNRKYIILGIDKYFTDEDKEINFSNKLKSIIEKTNKPIKEKKLLKNLPKKVPKMKIFIFLTMLNIWEFINVCKKFIVKI
jgi:hypothetical protein